MSDVKMPKMQPPGPGEVLLRSNGSGSEWLLFASPVGLIQAHRIGDVIPALREIERAVGKGLFAAGLIGYEAAPAFDPAFDTYPLIQRPLLWFGIYEGLLELPALPVLRLVPDALDWQPDISRQSYSTAVAAIKESIARGDTYQVNFSYRLRSRFSGEPWKLFSAMYHAQETGCAAFLNMGEHVVCSVSPELFFALSGDEIVCRPMKGTLPRAATTVQDDLQAVRLRTSEKDRAENLMIVDMVRNDLGRIAIPGTVRVPSLFEVERFDTVWQMTSTVSAMTTAPVSEILRALFPCASVTGAPKVETMRIIRSLESSPRGVYTGCIGYVAPGRRARFSVAIRTVHVDRAGEFAEYGVGGGIVWDSTDVGEYAECLTKASVLTWAKSSFSLLETLLWQPGKGYFLLELHLERMAGSAGYFGFRFDRCAAERSLQEAARTFPPVCHRVRIAADSEGVLTLQAEVLRPGTSGRRWRLALARNPIDRSNRFLYHKTTHRRQYQDACTGLDGCDDVILWNEAGEVTESTIANIVLRQGGELITPPVSSGLLPGVFREHLLSRGRIREGVIRLEDLNQGEPLYLINSVRGWIPTAGRFR